VDRPGCLALRARTTENSGGTQTFQFTLARCRLGEIHLAAGRLAQLVERLLYTQDVGGSNPSPPTNDFHWLPLEARKQSTAECPGGQCRGWTPVPRTPEAIEGTEAFFGRQDHLIKIKLER
jgi:hypothetical protein